MKSTLFGWILIFAIVSCTPPRSLEYRDYHNFAIKSLGFNQSTVSLELEYYNPNNFGMQLKNTDLDIYIDGRLLGHSRSDSLITIPRRGTFILPVKFEVDMRNAFKHALNTLAGREITLRLEGKIRAGKGKVFLLFPVKYEARERFSIF